MNSYDFPQLVYIKGTKAIIHKDMPTIKHNLSAQI